MLFFDNHEASKTPWTKDVWYFDYRTNIHHTLKKKPLRFEHLAEFIECYNPKNRHKRKATWDTRKSPDGRWRKFTLQRNHRARQDEPRCLLAEGQGAD